MFKSTAIVLFVQCIWSQGVGRQVKDSKCFYVCTVKISFRNFYTVALLSTVGRVGVFFTQTDTTSSYVVGKCKSGVFFQAHSVFAPRASS